MKKVIFKIFVPCSVLAFSCRHNLCNSEDLLKIDVNSFNGQNGWGYEIKVDNKNFIRQDFIPSVQGKKGFATKADALKTAKLVVWKMKMKKSPAISLAELNSLGIVLNQNGRSSKGE